MCMCLCKLPKLPPLLGTWKNASSLPVLSSLTELAYLYMGGGKVGGRWVEGGGKVGGRWREAL